MKRTRESFPRPKGGVQTELKEYKKILLEQGGFIESSKDCQSNLTFDGKHLTDITICYAHCSSRCSYFSKVANNPEYRVFLEGPKRKPVYTFSRCFRRKMKRKFQRCL